MKSKAGNNVGKRIKGIAFLFALFCVIASIIFAISVYEVFHDSFKDQDMLRIIVVGVVICGIVLAWFAHALLYGYGELIDQTYQINAKLSGPIGGMVPENQNDVPAPAPVPDPNEVPAPVPVPVPVPVTAPAPVAAPAQAAVPLTTNVYCHICGTPLRPNANACEFCGTEVTPSMPSN